MAIAYDPMLSPFRVLAGGLTVKHIALARKHVGKVDDDCFDWVPLSEAKDEWTDEQGYHVIKVLTIDEQLNIPAGAGQKSETK